MNNFGQYRFKDTLIHRMDARKKLIAIVLLSLIVFIVKAYGLLLFTAGAFWLTAAAKVPPKNIARNMKPFLFFSVFLITMYLLFSPQELVKGILAVWRFLLLAVFSSVLLYTTSIGSMINAVESLAQPLRSVNVKPRNVALMLAMAIRFIPLLFEESASVKDAIIARGGSFRQPKIIVLYTKAMLGRAFRRADRVADALVSRNYTAEGHTKFAG
ncbi:energy-coupling factor transporter transmembrane protein EcfT [Candidatus Woesearchaeota archaeon]|nr:energy-coupling factor transporter transmembrane protein EcfT [Candidatus Woesearchaeota archaeon]